eukprot:1589999-Lingulodinium_polyedra.AAC.1
MPEACLLDAIAGIMPLPVEQVLAVDQPQPLVVEEPMQHRQVVWPLITVHVQNRLAAEADRRCWGGLK